MNSKDIANMGIAVALLFVTGYVVYIISKPLILPGAKFLLMAPLLSFVQFFPLIRRPKATTLLLLNTGFAILLALMSPLMSVAILLSGLLSSMVYGTALKLFGVDWAIRMSLSSYSVWAMLISFYISLELTGLKIYGDSWSLLLVFVAIGCLILGWFGTVFGYRISNRMYPVNKGPLIRHRKDEKDKT